MATISPFKALRPQEVYADKLLSLTSSSCYGQSDGMIARKLDKGHHGNTALSNEEILLNLKRMISAGDFYQEEHPCIFIYEITENGFVQTGVWAVTHLDDFENGHIKVHESTIECNSLGLMNYRDEVGLEGGPLMLTHQPSYAIKCLLQQIKRAEANSVYYANKVFHRIWTVYDMKTIRQLSTCFSDLEEVYLADGHHRLAAAVKFRQMRGKGGSSCEDFNYISSFYLACDQLRLKEYHRVVIPSEEICTDQIFRELKRTFSMTKSPRNELVMPLKHHEFGMCMEGQWYNMTYKLKEIPGFPDACMLQDMVFRPCFKIEHPETDQRLLSVGGENAIPEILRIISENEQAIVFTMTAMNADQLIDIAQQGIMLPPKSTWVEPKIPFGLLLRKLQENKLLI